MRARRRAHEDTEIDMTPMLDVVFILLIFFIVTSSPDKTQNLEVVLPTASEVENVQMQALEIQVNEDESIIYEGDQYTISEAFSLIIEKRSEFKDLVVYADKDLRTEVFVDIADFAKSHGYDNIAIATKEADR